MFDYYEISNPNCTKTGTYNLWNIELYLVYFVLFISQYSFDLKSNSHWMKPNDSEESCCWQHLRVELLIGFCLFCCCFFGYLGAFCSAPPLFASTFSQSLHTIINRDSGTQSGNFPRAASDVEYQATKLSSLKISQPLYQYLHSFSISVNEPYGPFTPRISVNSATMLRWR